MHAERCSRFSAVVVVILERRENRCGFGLLTDSGGESWVSRVCRAHFVGKVFDFDVLSAAQDDRSLDDVRQLPDISRPVMVQ